MILETIKFKKILAQPEDILRIFLSLVFLSAGIFRIFNYQAVVMEFSQLEIPIFFSYLVILFEIIAGLFLLFNKFSHQIYYLLVFFVTSALIWAFMINGRSLLADIGELFVFNLNPTDVFLHFVFLLIVIYLILRRM